MGVLFAVTQVVSIQLGGARNWLPQRSPLVKDVLLTGLLLVIWVLAPGETPEFIYFRF